MRVIIAGGRDYRLTDQDRQWLDELRSSMPITEVVCGMGKGADLDGRDWAITRDVPVRDFKADWARRGRGAGPVRNQAMADYADALIAFPGGKGTADMIRKASARGLTIVRPVGADRG